jgi:hypothetical protein
MTVPYTFGTATTSIPLSNLDANFNTPITLGNTSIYLGNTTTTIGNLTLTNVTISSGTANITSNITYTTANAVVFTNASSIGTTSSALTFDGTTITSTKFAGAFNGTVGATTASSGAFTTGTFSGAVTLGAISSFGTSLLHTIGGHSFVQGDANATYLYGGAGIGIQLRNSANSATLVTFADSLTTYTSPVTFNAAITLGAVSSFGTSLTHTIGGHLFVQGDATTTYLYGGTGGISFRNAANTSELAIITNAGNVGIGTSSPGTIFHVSGATSGLMTLQNTSASDDNVQLRIIGSSGNRWIVGNNITGGTGLNFDIYDWANSTLRMRIDSSGNLLVGTTSAAGKLAVYGTNISSPLLAVRDEGTPAANLVSVSANSLGTVFSVSSAGIIAMGIYGAGTATFSASGVISSVSDETWKVKDGVPTNTDAMLQKLEPGYWFYNEEKAPTFGEERQLGFYAQNVHEAIGEEAAPTPQEGKPWGYHDRSVLAVAVMSLKNALNTIEELKQRIATLENK